MKHVFQRGSVRSSAEADSVLFRFGSPPQHSPGSTYSCEWEGPQPTVTLTTYDHSENVPLLLLKEGAGGYSFSHPQFGSIVLVKALWFQDRPQIQGERGAVMSFQGWSQGSWCDGVYGRWEHSQFTDLILSGSPFQVEWGRSFAPPLNIDAWYDKHKFLAQKMSLIEAVRSHYKASIRRDLQLQMDLCTVEEVLTFLLLRLAFPKQKFSFFPRCEGQKRLAQNLNFTVLREPSKKVCLLPLLVDWGSNESVRNLLEWQMRKSPFIPGKIWADLQG